MQAPLFRNRDMMKQANKQGKSIPVSDSHESPLRLVLQVADPAGGANRVVAARLNKPRLIAGRVSSGGDTPLPPPDLDFSAFNGLNNGVSRQHAVFCFEDGALSVEDMSSTNGTRINGFQIQPGRQYRLRNGDELELGRLRMSVKIVRTPY